MRTFLFVVVFTIITIPLKAQFILAGQHTASDYYTDILDVTLNTCPNCGDVSDFIDINRDGVIDFEIRARRVWSSGNKAFSTLILANGNGQIALEYIDSCNYTMAKSFTNNDTISNITTWDNGPLYMSFWYTSGFGPSTSSCGDETFDSSMAYLGVRIFLPVDTLYGWIKVGGVSSGSCTIYEYASGSGNSGISVIDAEVLGTISPNPVSTFLTIEFNSTGIVQMEVLNMLGILVYKTELPSNQKNQIDLSAIGKGLYTVHLYNGDSSVKRKLVKQ